MKQPSNNSSSTHLARSRVPASRTLAFWLLLLLSVQYVVGMLTNLYVSVPAHHPGSQSSNYFSGVVAVVAWAGTQGTWELRIHALLGLLLILIGVALIGAAVKRRQRVWIVSSIIAVLFIIGAGFNGASFLIYGEDFSSLIMSLAFAIALVGRLHANPAQPSAAIAMTGATRENPVQSG
jgi:hypothetical protein